MRAAEGVLRIAQVSSFYRPATGGVAGVAACISEELARRGHSLTVFTSDRNIDGTVLVGASPDEVLNGVRVRRFRSAARIGFMTYCPALAKQLRLAEFDVIHTHSYRHPNSAAGIAVAREMGIPAILHEHGSFRERGSRWSAKSLLYRGYDLTAGKKVLATVSSTVSPTEAGRRRFLELGVPFERTAVIPNAVRVQSCSREMISQVAQRFHVDSRRLILFIGSLDKNKNPMLAVNAMRRVVPIFPDALLALVGPDRGMGLRTARLIAELKLEAHCRLLGPLYGAEKDALVAAAKLVVISSNREAFSLVALEAMSHGKPLVATRTAGPMTLVDEGITGFLVPPGDPSAMAEAIVVLLSDDVRARTMGREARERSSKYSVESVVDRIEDLYRSVIGRGS